MNWWIIIMDFWVKQNGFKIWTDPGITDTYNSILRRR